MAVLICAGHPLPTSFALRTDGLALLPIERKGRLIRALPCFGLPLDVLTHWADHFHPVTVGTGNDEACIHLSRIQHLSPRLKTSCFQSLIDDSGSFPLGFGSIGGRTRGDQVRQIAVTGFTDMHVVPKPSQIPLRSRVCLMVRGRADGQMDGGHIITVRADVRFPPAKSMATSRFCTRQRLLARHAVRRKCAASTVHPAVGSRPARCVP